MNLKPMHGDLLKVGRAASVQFSTQPIRFRVISALEDRHTYDGWIWLRGYQMTLYGDAIAQREIYVRVEGLELLQTPTRTSVAKAGGRKAVRSQLGPRGSRV